MTKRRKAGNGLAEDDLVTAGFHRLDRDISKRAPRIKWGLLYGKKTDRSKIEYLEKLAAAMNFAAFTIQNERDAIGKLLVLKEAQIKKAKSAIDANNAMIQQQITHWNAEKKGLLATIKDLRTRLAEYEPEAKSKIPESWRRDQAKRKAARELESDGDNG